VKGLTPQDPLMMASDADRLGSLFGTPDAIPLWVAETYVPVAAPITAALKERASTGWFGYETRPAASKDAFWSWMNERHGWSRDGLRTIVSPSVGTSIGVMIDELTAAGDGVVIQPPVFTDFKPLITSAGRRPIRNALTLGVDGYSIDISHLEEVASDPSVKLMILCNPHNPVGRVWTASELRDVASVCAANDVAVIADEIHADVVMPGNRFVPFAVAARGTGVSWVATHGPIKTFGLAGLCDSLLITDDDEIASAFKAASNRLHLTRNNVFSTVAFATAYRKGGPWLEELLSLVLSNVGLLRRGLAPGAQVMSHEATYLAWLDFRALDLEVSGVANLISTSGVAMSPGHWFGREGAGFARMTVAAPPASIEMAIERINAVIGAAP
jgi:cystathionine beta-lyase